MRLKTLALAGMLLLGSPAFADGEEPLANWQSPPYWTPPAGQHARAALAVSTPLPFIALTPCRIVDTRGNAPLTGGFLPAATVRSYTVTNVCGIPPGAQALSLNATVVHPTGEGFLVLYPEGGTFPPVSTLNFLGNDVIVNAAVVPLSATGGISMALGVSGGDVILDTNGYYAPQTVVTTLNGASGAVALAAGSNVTLTPSGQTLTIASTGGVTLAGSGSASTASHSDHDHIGAAWCCSGGLYINSLDGTNAALRGVAPQIGVHGSSYSSLPLSAGVYGSTSNANGNGVWGVGGPGTGVKGTSTGSNGVFGTTSSGAASGVYGENNATGGFGVAGRAPVGQAVYGETTTGTAVHGEVTGSAGTAILGVARGSGIGLSAQNVDGGTAGFFFGNVDVQGSLTKSSGSFKIDHPLDPENKYLYHSFVESPDMMNIYNGLVTTDERGYATVELPEWFEALNRDFRYQLTVLDETDGDSFVHSKIVKGVSSKRFTLRTSAPHARVSWQVTGIRKDAWAESHRIPVEEVKAESERGRFLHPREHGRQVEDGILGAGK
ncbi:MAG: hypothetical protein NEA02_00405 [Thermoanaerobaculia bacterium]|nr:hypothetical protein [Thermoanaerobaculia bacterium]